VFVRVLCVFLACWGVCSEKVEGGRGGGGWRGDECSYAKLRTDGCEAEALSMYVYMYLYMYVNIYVHVYVYICICTCICIYICICMCDLRADGCEEEALSENVHGEETGDVEKGDRADLAEMKKKSEKKTRKKNENAYV